MSSRGIERRFRGTLVAGILLPLALACQDTARETQPAESAERSDTAGAMTEEAAGAPGGETAGVEGGTLSEDQIESVVATINKGEIQLAQLAQEKATRPEVKQFAQKLENEHAGLNTQLRVTTEDTGAAASNQLVSTLEADAQATVQELQGLSGAEFDRRYIESQVRMHRTALGAIEERLIPSAQDAELQDVLETARTSVAEHLEQAEQIQESLGAGA